MDLDGVYRKLSKSSRNAGQFALANQALSDMNQFVPMREGTLRTTGHVSSDNEYVIYNTLYARRQFYAPGGWNYTTPGTGPRWDLKAKGMFINDWVEAYTKGANWK